MSKKTVKLTKKELEVVTAIQNKKNELVKAYQGEIAKLNENESIIVQLVMERGEITETPNKIDIENDSLVFEFNDEKQEEKPKVKTRKLKIEE